MDIVILTSIAVGIISLLIALAWYTRRNTGKKAIIENEQAARGQPVRRAGVRNARRRMQAGRAEPDEQAEDASADEDEDKADTAEFGKIGAKKRAKLEAKAEKKQQREALEKERDERRKQEQLRYEEADRQREKEKAEEREREEAEKKAREEKERQEHEEYIKLKEAFSVEEEGFDQEEIDEANLLRDFVEYIKQNKVVILEDLAGHFKLKTTSAIERVQALQANGTLTGVIDDRGKFIYISQNELEAVAKFVKQRGRISITDLAENSNRLINLNPEISASISAS